MSGMTPTDIANQALDAIGVSPPLGDMEDGSDRARVILRAYRECLKQLLRAAHWNFARKTAPLTLLADASGNTSYVGTVVPTPWIYEYAYPTDCAKARFVPWNLSNQASLIPQGNIQIPQTPLVDGLGQQGLGQPMRPAKFVEATDFNYPPQQGQLTWDVQGVSPQGRTVILTNVRYAQMVYTAIMLYPSVWDPLFRAAFVSYLAAEVALPIWAQEGDRKFGLELRVQQAAIVRDKVMEARAIDGNEGTFSSDIAVDWMRGRRSFGPYGFGYGAGGAGWGGDGGPGVYGNGYDSLMVAGGSVF